MIRQNKPILSLADLLEVAQANYGVAPIVDPSFNGDRFQSYHPSQIRRNARDYPNLDPNYWDYFGDPDPGFEPDTGELEPTASNLAGIAGNLAAFASGAVPATLGMLGVGPTDILDALRGRPSREIGLTPTAKTFQDFVDPYNYDPFDTTLDEFGPEAYGGGFGPDSLDDFTTAADFDPSDYGGGIGPGGIDGGFGDNVGDETDFDDDGGFDNDDPGDEF